MRLRLLAFFPLAVVITLGLLFSASSFVSALENSLTPETLPVVGFERFESVCDALYREIHELSHVVTSCGEDPLCLGSPLFCPVAMDSSIDREYETLRIELNERCGVPLDLMDYAWGGPAWGETEGREGPSGEVLPERAAASVSASVTDRCGTGHDWLEAATSGEAMPTSFVF